MNERPWVIRNVRVDDRVIDAGNPHDVIDPVWWQGDIYGSVDDYEASLKAFTRRQRWVFAALWYLAEVDNGGHDQFFYNSTGIVWPDALEAFREMELTEVAEVIEESGRRLGGTPDRDQSEREAQLEASRAEFADLDDRLYAIQERTDLEAAMADYIRAHRKDFYFEGQVRKPGS